MSGGEGTSSPPQREEVLALLRTFSAIGHRIREDDDDFTRADYIIFQDATSPFIFTDLKRDIRRVAFAFTTFSNWYLVPSSPSPEGDRLQVVYQPRFSKLKNSILQDGGELDGRLAGFVSAEDNHNIFVLVRTVMNIHNGVDFTKK